MFTSKRFAFIVPHLFEEKKEDIEIGTVRPSVRPSVSPYKPELHYGGWSIVLITIDVFDVIHSVSLVGLFSAFLG
jgi:hypothetical protein